MLQVLFLIFAIIFISLGFALIFIERLNKNAIIAIQKKNENEQRLKKEKQKEEQDRLLKQKEEEFKLQKEKEYKLQKKEELKFRRELEEKARIATLEKQRAEIFYRNINPTKTQATNSVPNNQYNNFPLKHQVSEKTSIISNTQNLQNEYCESNTAYTSQIHNIYLHNPRNFGLSTIKSLSNPFYNSITEEEQNQLFNELNQGVSILLKEGHLFIYMRAYGNMHQAKLMQAFESLKNLSDIIKGKDIQIIDYGCGQGIGSIVFIDYLKSIQQNYFTISKIKLIEPSKIALKRASLNVKYCLKSINQGDNTLSILKKIDDLTTLDLSTNSTSIKFHVFSNILDVEDFNINSLCNKINSTQNGTNYFICVSPNIMQSRNMRLDAFMNYFQQNRNTSVISARETNINNWRRYERIFKVIIS